MRGRDETDGFTLALGEAYQRRKYAPLHWKARAENAHSVAEFLWNSGASAIRADLYEGYLREAAVALELIIKAVIVALIDANLAPSHDLEESHDLPKLWTIAKLPVLSREDRYRLTYFKSVLTWLGRYPTPRTVDRWRKDISEREGAEPLKPRSEGPSIRRSIACGLTEFDALYRHALDRFHELNSARQCR